MLPLVAVPVVVVVAVSADEMPSSNLVTASSPSTAAEEARVSGWDGESNQSVYERLVQV